MTKTPTFIPLFAIALLFFIGCSDRYKAEQKLSTRGVEWSEEHFILSAQAGDSEVVTIFVDAGMNPNTTDAKGLSPLLLFSASGKKEMVEYLLKKSDIMLTDNSDRNALHHALMHHHFLLAPLLIKAGIDTTQIDNFGRLPIHYAAGATGKADIETLTLLIKARNNINKRDKEQNTPLMYATLLCDYETIKLLLAKGASITIRNGHGLTLYEIAEKKESESCKEVAEWLQKEYNRQVITLE